MNQFYVFSTVLGVYAFIEYYFKFKFRIKTSNKSFDITLYCITLPFLIIALIPIYKFEFQHFSPDILSLILFVVIFLVGLLLRFLGLREINKLFSHKIELQTDHKVIDTGIFKYIRHPLYSGSFLMSLGICFYFVNILSFFLLLVLLIGLLMRINKEEAFLKLNLPGYADYMRKTKKFVPKLF